MIIKLSKEFKQLVLDQVYYIYKDKPKAALKFRKNLIFNLRKDLINPFSYQKSKKRFKATLQFSKISIFIKAKYS